MSDKDSVPGFAIGFALGAAVGLGVAFLLAPRPGKEARQLLKDKAVGIPETIREHTANRQKVYTETWKKRQGQPKISDTYFE